MSRQGPAGQGSRAALVIPEAMALTMAASTAASLWRISQDQCQDRWLTILVLGAAFLFLHLTLFAFVLRPPGPHWARKTIGRQVYDPRWVEPFVFVAFMLVFVIGSMVVPMALIPQSAYAAEQFILALGGLLGLVFVVILFFMRRFSGPQRALLGPLRVWHLGMIAHLSVAGSSWPVAQWNPTINHYVLAAQISEVAAVEGVEPQDECSVDVGWFVGPADRTRCRVRFTCAGRRLFGGFGLGAFDCSVTKQGSLRVEGSDADTDDGDPAFDIDTARGDVRYADRDGGRITARILLEREF